MFTPEMLAELKVTLDDLPQSFYDHDTQTRKFVNEENRPVMYPSTGFDGEQS
jgi:hypothetical protein